MKVAGLGFRTGTTPVALQAALAKCGPVDALATAAPKAQALADALPGQRVIGVAVEGVPTPTQSPAALAAHGTGSVAEAAALIAAGPDARLLAPRQIIGGVAIALAEGKTQP